MKGAGELAQSLELLVDLAENLGSAHPHSNLKSFRTPFPGDLMLFSGLCRSQEGTWDMCTHKPN